MHRQERIVQGKAAAMDKWNGDKIIDREGALARLGGDEGLLRDLVQFFVEDSPGLLEQIRTSLRAGSAEELERAAHSLKGLAANFGAQHAVKAALELEQIGHSRSLSRAESALGELEFEIHRLTRALAAGASK